MKAYMRKLSLPIRVSGYIFLFLVFVILLGGIIIIDNYRENSSRHAWTYASTINFVHSEPDNPNSHAALASVYMDQKNYVQATEQARIAVRLAPHDAAMHCYLAEALRKAGQSFAARQEFQTTIALDTNHGWPTEQASIMLRTELK